MNYVYLNGQPVEHPHENHHHVSPSWLYAAVFGALLVLTAVTYAVSFAGLGPLGLPVAMIVAAMKATLVCAFFMHLASEDRLYVFAFLSSLACVGLFFTVVLFDAMSGTALNDGTEIGSQRRYEAPKAHKLVHHEEGEHGAEGEHAGGGDHAGEPGDAKAKGKKAPKGKKAAEAGHDAPAEH